MNLSRPFVFFLIFAAALGVYSSALSGQFIWDDDYLVRDNRYLTSWSHLPQIFSKDINAGADSSCGFYRPLQILSYRLDYLVWKLEPAGYHLTNILLHGLAAWLIFLLAEGLARKTAAFFASIIFLLHPVQAEAVAYISGRADLLAMVFMLLAILLEKRLIWSVALFALALLSKESALIFPALLLAWKRLVLKEKCGPKELLPYLLTALVYFGLRSTILVPWAIPVEAGNFFQRLPGVFAAFFGYFRTLLWPWSGLHMEYGQRFFGWSEAEVLKGLVVFALLAGWTWTAARKKSPALFGLAWFWISWIPVSGLFPLLAYMAEHWLYIPLLGLCWACGTLVKKKRALVPGLLAVGLFAVTAYLQNFYWSDPVSFSKTTLKYVPGSYRAEYTLGLYYGSIGEKARAAGHYERAFALNPSYTEAYYNLANLLASVHEDEEAVKYYLKAIKAGPSYAAAYNNLANVYSRKGEKGKAIEFYKKCLELEPKNAAAVRNLELELKASEKVVK